MCSPSLPVGSETSEMVHVPRLFGRGDDERRGDAPRLPRGEDFFFCALAAAANFNFCMAHSSGTRGPIECNDARSSSSSFVHAFRTSSGGTPQPRSVLFRSSTARSRMLTADGCSGAALIVVFFGERRPAGTHRTGAAKESLTVLGARRARGTQQRKAPAHIKVHTAAGWRLLCVLSQELVSDARYTAVSVTPRLLGSTCKCSTS